MGVPTVRDRVVQSALRNVIEPIFERDFAEQSYGFRPGRGCKDALRRVDQLMKSGYRYVVDADLKGYFDTIPHEGLMNRIREKISDGPAWPDCLATGIPDGSTDQEQPPRRENPPVAVLALIEMFLTQGVLDGLDRWTPERGGPQGAATTPLLSNIYLNPLDHLLADAGYEMVRYADDFVILCRTAEQAQAALTRVQQWTSANGLTLHPDKTRLVNVDAEVFEFLGDSFFGEHRWPRKKSLQKLKETLRQKTRRTNSHSLPFIIADANRTLRGWFEYFKHSHKWTFPRIDGWLRMRLRSILRKRAGRKGRGRGWDHHRWKNSFFAERGLFNLTAAHALACQSSRQGKPPTGEPCARDPHARFGGRGG